MSAEAMGGDAVSPPPPPPPGLWETPPRTPQSPGASSPGDKKAWRRERKGRKGGGKGSDTKPAFPGGLLSTLPNAAATPPPVTAAALNPADEAVKQEQGRSILLQFKTMPCRRETPHDHRCCLFYHTERDRRRPVYGDNPEPWGPTMPVYVAEPCSESFDDKKVCARGDECIFCHSTVELLYHPEFFRKRLCNQALTTGCPRAHLCASAHSRQELLAPYFTEEQEKNPSEEFVAWNFKTQWCPMGVQHDWETCMYAHTYRDWRRTPAVGYSSRPCPQWAQSVASGPTELIYEMRCPNGMACPLAHGAKEQLYHPQFYKTSRCSENCKRGALCAFTHGEYDRREPPAGPQLTAEELALTAMWPIPWALDTLASHQPGFINPPRYHALEEQAGMHKGGKVRGGRNRTNPHRGDAKDRGSPGGAGSERCYFPVGAEAQMVCPIARNDPIGSPVQVSGGGR